MTDLSEFASTAALALPDETHHAVLADRYLELGDSRGEFIALSLVLANTVGHMTTTRLQHWRKYKLVIEPEATRQVARLNQLRLRHQKTWLGALAPIAKYAQYHLGLLDSLGLQNTAAASGPEWAAAATAPELATVRTFLKGKGTPTQMVAFLAAGQLRALRRLEVPHRDVIEQLERQPVATLWDVMLSCQLKAAAGLGRVAPTLRSLHATSARSLEELGAFVARERTGGQRWRLTCKLRLDSVRELEPLLEHVEAFESDEVRIHRLEHGWALEEIGLAQAEVSRMLRELPSWVTSMTVRIAHTADFRQDLESLHERGVRVRVYHRLGTYGLGGQTVDFEP